MEPYYNISYGQGFGGVINYTNTLVDGYLVMAFVAFLYIIIMFVGSKGEWKLSGVSAVASLLCLITAMGFRLITTVNDLVIYASALILAISVGAMYVGGRQ